MKNNVFSIIRLSVFNVTVFFLPVSGGWNGNIITNTIGKKKLYTENNYDSFVLSYILFFTLRIDTKNH